MIDPPPVRNTLLPVVVLIAAVYACSIYANLSFTVADGDDFRLFPPFERGVNANRNDQQTGEYFNVAKSLASAQGFSHPFSEPTGPTAWVPPVFPMLLAGLFWICAGDPDSVMMVLVFLQMTVLIVTGLLVLTLARRTATRVGVALLVFLILVLGDFRSWFQSNNESWLILLALDLLIAGLCWFQPLYRWQTATAWGLFGGLCALINPILGLVWASLSVLVTFQQRAWSRLGIATLMAGITLMPWTVRNYLVFHRLIPVRSNLAFELYQSQCLIPNGLLGSPSGVWIREAERELYKAVGESRYLDRARELFWQSVKANPQSFLRRAGRRFLAATLWYEPVRPVEEARRPWLLWTCRLIHPLPFLALLVLVASSVWRPLPNAQWTVIGVYLIFLGPYFLISYHDRYALPLMGVKVLLVVWGADRLLSLLFRRERDDELAATLGAETG